MNIQGSMYPRQDGEELIRDNLSDVIFLSIVLISKCLLKKVTTQKMPKLI